MTNLMQEGIDRLRAHPERRCEGALKRGEMVCAEGVFAELLVEHFPERFYWFFTMASNVGSLMDREDGNVAIDYVMLQNRHWRIIHPAGVSIVSNASWSLECASLSEANDHKHADFVVLADALQAELDKVERRG